MGREGHGRGARLGAVREDADAARRPRGPAHEDHGSREDDGSSRGEKERREGIMKRLGLVLVWSALSMGAALAQTKEPLTKVRVAYDGFSMTSAPLAYADKLGTFKAFGLYVTPTFVEGGSTLTQAVVGGSVDIAQNGYTPAAAAAVQGADVVFIGGIANKLPFQLVVKKEITSVAQLRGGSIAISRFGSSTDQAADFALAHLGLKRN